LGIHPSYPFLPPEDPFAHCTTWSVIDVLAIGGVSSILLFLEKKNQNASVAKMRTRIQILTTVPHFSSQRKDDVR
jgi:hypothetical protein